MQNENSFNLDMDYENCNEKIKQLMELIVDLKEKSVEFKFESEIANTNLLINFNPNILIKIDEMEKKIKNL